MPSLFPDNVDETVLKGWLDIDELALCLLLVLNAILGITVSTTKVTELLGSAPSVLALPAASVNTPLDTLTVPLVVLLAVGVNKAV